VQARVGTSGFAYDFWKGSFYPEELDDAHMLAFYSRSFTTVEVNNTFYRMPKRDVMERWAKTVPANFRFTIKASRRITHVAKLRDCQDSVDYLYRQLEPLGPKLGAVLFQCPPSLEIDLARLQAFVGMLPEGARAAIEFRHPSWFEDDVFACLREAGVAMCIGDYDAEEDAPLPTGETPFVPTAPWGYVRLRDSGYDDAALEQWARRIGDAWTESFVFFKHEQSAPELVERLVAVFEAMPG